MGQLKDADQGRFADPLGFGGEASWFLAPRRRVLDLGLILVLILGLVWVWVWHA